MSRSSGQNSSRKRSSAVLSRSGSVSLPILSPGRHPPPHPEFRGDFFRLSDPAVTPENKYAISAQEIRIARCSRARAV